MAGTMFPGTIVPIRLDRLRLGPYFNEWTNLKARALGGHHLAILTCPGCSRGGLRVPDGRRGKVTCPRCGAEWFYPETIELSEVEFRCSESGARFVVQTSRRSPLHKFVIQAIKHAPPRPSNPIDPDSHGAEDDLVQALSGSTDRLPGPKSGGLMARLFGRPKAIAAAAEPSLPSQEPENVSPVTRSTYDADQYNWSSFICPYCSATSFVKCSKGNHLVCDGTTEMRSGRRFHQCFCGHAAFIEGTIKTIEGDQSSIEHGNASTPHGANSVGSKEGPSPSPLDPAPRDATPLLGQAHSGSLPNSGRARRTEK
jgi:hypothetical protein